MAIVHLSPLFNGWQGFGNTGQTLAGGKLLPCAAGTGIAQATYTTNLGTVLNPNTITLDSAGRPPNEIWLVEGLAYAFYLTDSLGNPLGAFDNITGIGDMSLGAVNFGGTVTFNGQVNFNHDTAFIGAARRFKGDFSNATISDRLIFQTSTANGNTDICLVPDGASTQSSLNVFNAPNPNAAGFGHIAMSNGEFSLQSSRTGGAAALPMTFYCGIAGVAETMRLTTAQEVLIGTVTSPTNGAKLRVNSLVQLDNACAFSVHRNGVNFNVNNTTFTQIAFTTKDFDQNTSFSTGTSRFTPPSGKYLLQGSAGQTGGVANQRLVMLLYKNGAAFKDFSTTAGGAAAFGVTGCAVVDANGTDFFEVYLYQDSGGATTMSGATVDTYFTGFRIG